MRLGPTLLFPVLLCTALLTACEDEPEPKIVEPTSTAPPATTATTSSAVPTTSVPPKRETAKEFVIRFNEEESAMRATGNTGTYRALSPQCSDCVSLADAIEDIYGKGGRLVGKEPVTTQVHRVGRVRDAWIFEYTYDAPPSKVVDASGKVTKRFTGGRARFQINVRRVNGDWQVLRLSQKAVEP